MLFLALPFAPDNHVASMMMDRRFKGCLVMGGHGMNRPQPSNGEALRRSAARHRNMEMNT